MTNRYPGQCKRCRGQVAAGEGTCDKQNGRWVVAHNECPAREASAPVANQAEALRISRGEGYGGQPYKVGQVLRHKTHGAVIVLTASERYIREDGMSFGVGDEEGCIYSATVRPATDKEALPLIECEAEHEAQKSAEALRTKLAETIKAEGERPDGDNSPEGERVSDRQNIYGGGDWFVVGADYLWYVQNNGMDGDNWEHNNVRTGGAGAIGQRVPRTEELAAQVLSVATA